MEFGLGGVPGVSRSTRCALGAVANRLCRHVSYSHPHQPHRTVSGIVRNGALNLHPITQSITRVSDRAGDRHQVDSGAERVVSPAGQPRTLTQQRRVALIVAGLIILQACATLPDAETRNGSAARATRWSSRARMARSSAAKSDCHSRPAGGQGRLLRVAAEAPGIRAGRQRRQPARRWATS